MKSFLLLSICQNKVFYSSCSINKTTKVQSTNDFSLFILCFEILSVISRKIAESFYALHKSLIPPQQHIKPNIILRFLFFSSSLFHLHSIANQIAQDFKCFISADYRRFITLNVTQLHSTKPKSTTTFITFLLNYSRLLSKKCKQLFSALFISLSC